MNTLSSSVAENTKSSITESDLYAMGMESQTAWQKMQELCAALGMPFPPQPEAKPVNTGPLFEIE